MENSFLPPGYEAPKSGGYTELIVGENQLRILSTPLMLWLEFRDGKAIRHPYNGPDSAPPKGPSEKDGVKHAWAMIVYNYRTAQIEVWECDKKGLQAAITAYSQKPAWGHPKNYDIVVKKSGSGMQTEYALTTEPPSEPSNAIIEAYTDTPIDLNQMLVPNGNPFIGKQAAAGTTPNNQPAATQQKVVTPENWVVGDPVPQGWLLSADGTSIEKKKLPF